MLEVMTRALTLSHEPLFDPAMSRLLAKMVAATGAVLLAGCAQTPKPARPAPLPARPFAGQGGLDRVMGQNARSLTLLFGQPIQDVREPNARKLQFGGAGCVLDAYLYARKKGQEPVVTYIDTRLSDGNDIDRAACIAALSRK